MDLLGEALAGQKVYSITFPTGERVPFKTLCWQDFTVYRDIVAKGSIPQDVWEDAIFRKCVIDPLCIENSLEYRAGIVSTVVSLILSMSGPNDLNVFNESMNIARNMVDDLGSQIVMVICRAFPGYTPEDVQQLPWRMVLIRLAQAERILMSKNPPELVEPLRMLTAEEMNKESQKVSGKVDVKELIKDGQKIRDFDRPDLTMPNIGQRPEGPAEPKQYTQEQMRQVELNKKIRQRVTEQRTTKGNKNAKRKC